MVATKEAAAPTRAATVGGTARRARVWWPHDEVLWGVERRPGHFDLEDPKGHAGRIQHAFPMGRDEAAICGFRPALRRDFDGVRRPLLAAASAGLNPRCGACAAQIAYAPPPWIMTPPTTDDADHQAHVPTAAPGTEPWPSPPAAPWHAPGPWPAAPESMHLAVAIPIRPDRPHEAPWPANDLAQSPATVEGRAPWAIPVGPSEPVASGPSTSDSTPTEFDTSRLPSGWRRVQVG